MKIVGFFCAWSAIRKQRDLRSTFLRFFKVTNANGNNIVYSPLSP